ncbi:MAG TPA: class I SAM-dependent methyltransferase [Candidatus Methylomirabilis sp.]
MRTLIRQTLHRYRRARRLVRTIVLDLRYGAFLGGTDRSRYRYLGAHDIENSEYEVLAQIFEGRVAPTDVLVDVGCGKGRVLNWWLSQDLTNRIIGIELDPHIATATRRRLRRYPNVAILTGNALALLPREGTLFFLFNPFAAWLLPRLKERLEVVAGSRPDVRILYDNPPDLTLFRTDPAWTVEEFAINLPWKRRYGTWALIQRASVTPR